MTAKTTSKTATKTTKTTKTTEASEPKVQKLLPFKVGADPEFAGFANQTSISFSSLVPSTFGKKYGDTIKIPKVGQVGTEGSSLELRPVATNSPTEMADNMGRMFKELLAANPWLTISPLTISAPIGGHIHLEIPTRFTNPPTDPKIQKAKRILMTYLLPILAAEHLESAYARFNGAASGVYGKLDDFRIEMKDPANSTYTLEIRSITPEWAISHKLTEATFAYIGTVWNEILNDKLDIKTNKALIKNGSQSEIIQKSVFMDYTFLTDAIINEIKNHITTFELYPEFKEQCDFILDKKAVLAEKAAAGWNINGGWLPKEEKTLTKENILDEKNVVDLLKQANIEGKDSEYRVSYWKDVNAVIFKNALVERIMVLKWQLKYNYAIYGLKKNDTRNKILATTLTPSGVMVYSHPDNINHEDVRSITERKTEQAKVVKRDEGYLPLDPLTGEVYGTDTQKSTILIGIPYATRIEKDTKDFLSIIWDIENNILPAKNLSEIPETIKTTKELNAKDAKVGVTNDAEAISTHSKLVSNIGELENAFKLRRTISSNDIA